MRRRDRGSGTRDRGSGRAGAFPRARKRFGQHFLEPAWVDKLIALLAPSPDDTFIEIGPGRGALTHALASRVRTIVAVEIDRDLAAALARGVPPHVRIVESDVLDVDLGRLVLGESRPARVVGNLPYNISSPIVFKLIHDADQGRLLRDATLMVQKEVADRLVAIPGTREYGSLAIQVSLHADVERLLTLPPGAFRPPPKVTSSVVRLRFRSPSIDVGDPAVFERLVRGVFLQRRKMLSNALGPVADSWGLSARELIDEAGLDGSARPEELTLAEMARLARAVL